MKSIPRFVCLFIYSFISHPIRAYSLLKRPYVSTSFAAYSHATANPKDFSIIAQLSQATRGRIHLHVKILAESVLEMLFRLLYNNLYTLVHEI